MSKFYILKIIYELQYFRYLLLEYITKNPYDNNSAKKFINFNNKRVLRKIKKEKVKKIAILLPHCIQKYDCNLKR